MGTSLSTYGNKSVVSLVVKDRHSDAMVEEHIPIYLRLCYQTMYQNPVGRQFIKTSCIKGSLVRFSTRLGTKYDKPESVAEIEEFIRMYRINIEEVRLPLTEFKTFNDFFARELKEGCRPKADADIISPADCRVVVYQDWTEGNKLWLKGQLFSVSEVLGPGLEALAKRFARCSMAIFRLAPNDYHRWHLPFAATLGPRYAVKGEYYSVSPRAVTNCNILGRNKREVCVLESPVFGTSLLVPVGAAGVGGINIVGEENQSYEQGAEHGYFTYGGSTLLMLFEENSVIFDEDLVANSKQPIETMLRVGERIGRSARQHNKSLLSEHTAPATEGDDSIAESSHKRRRRSSTTP